MRRINLISAELDTEQAQEGYSWRARRIGSDLGSERTGASLYELPDGETTFPYHYHHGIEEWLYVVSGSPLVRTPGGERTLRSGDLLCFPANAEGAHLVSGPGRVLLLSANRRPSISVYPDSSKIGSRPGPDAPEDNLNFHRADAIGYWEGE